jgi:hypothetical protein
MVTHDVLCCGGWRRAMQENAQTLALISWNEACMPILQNSSIAFMMANSAVIEKVSTTGPGFMVANLPINSFAINSESADLQVRCQ